MTFDVAAVRTQGIEDRERRVMVVDDYSGIILKDITLKSGEFLQDVVVSLRGSRDIRFYITVGSSAADFAYDHLGYIFDPYVY
jgi:hypothetical protein